MVAYIYTELDPEGDPLELQKYIHYVDCYMRTSQTGALYIERGKAYLVSFDSWCFHSLNQLGYS